MKISFFPIHYSFSHRNTWVIIRLLSAEIYEQKRGWWVAFIASSVRGHVEGSQIRQGNGKFCNTGRETDLFIGGSSGWVRGVVLLHPALVVVLLSEIQQLSFLCCVGFLFFFPLACLVVANPVSSALPPPTGLKCVTAGWQANSLYRYVII